MGQPYETLQPSRAELEAMDGPVVLEFGTNWCGVCASAAPAVSRSMGSFPQVRHLKVEDGPGLVLGRSFGIKLWPTLIFLKQGVESERLVRPRDPAVIGAALRRLVEAPSVSARP